MQENSGFSGILIYPKQEHVIKFFYYYNVKYSMVH